LISASIELRQGLHSAWELTVIESPESDDITFFKALHKAFNYAKTDIVDGLISGEQVMILDFQREAA